MIKETRKEHDFLGPRDLPEGILYGIHTARAMENFPLAGRTVHSELIHAYGHVKQACAVTNQQLGLWKKDPPKADAIIRACVEMAEGLLDQHILVDVLQGGAGTSLNMNVNEVIANRALEILGLEHGCYDRVSPLDDINCHQSTNDTYPTAMKLAAIRLIGKLQEKLVILQEAFQEKEKQFAHVVKVARTELQDAVLTTLGRQMGAYAEAFARDRWRVYKCHERLRVVNLGGTAIGTGLTAPRKYIFRVVDTLREITGIGFARAENLVEATQNTDVFVEVSGILKACASSLLKISTDLRLMSSGPQAGLGEINLPARQAGSSIMPGKVNPVIPEAVSQAAMIVMGNDVVITQACSAGNLELNAFLPLIAACLLDSCQLLTNSCHILSRYCVQGITANEDRCRQTAEGSTAIITSLLPAIGYEQATQVVLDAQESGKTIKQVVLEKGLLDEKTLRDLISPDAVNRLGWPDE